MRKPLGLFVAAFATVAGGGLAMALEAEEGTENEPQVVEQESTTSSSTSSSTSSTTDTTEAVEVEAEHEGDGGEHGARVSEAADLCHDMVEAEVVNPDTGEPYRNHGECVSRVARDHDGDGTPDTPPTDEAEVEADDADDADAGPGAGHGRGHGRGGNHD